LKNEQGFLTDFKRIQVISALAATSAVFATFLVLFYPIPTQAKINIVIAAFLVFVFILIYYLIPKLYLNKKFLIIPDLVYISALTFVMRELGPYGYIYVIFFMILAAIDAFIFPLYQYAIIIAGMIVGILLANLGSLVSLESGLFFEVYGVIVIAIVLHLIARDALELREKKEGLETEIGLLENDKREIRTLLESIADGMFVVDAQNKIKFFNKAALSILNIVAPEERILGRDINDFLPTIGPNGAEPVTREAFGSYNPSRRNDFRVVKNGKALKLHTNVTPVLDEAKKLEGAIVFFRDITKEKNLDEQRAEFNAVASHELRTPLTIIEGYLFFLLDPASEAKYDNATRGYIEKAHYAAQNLIHLITDILTVVRAEEKELDVNLEKINIKDLVKEVVKTHEAGAKKKGLTLALNITVKKKVPQILTDPTKIREVLSNLIENAIKFTEKGSITVELGALENELIISVADTGEGIDELDQKNIFQKFYRAENWQTRKTSGTGLGLYIVKTLIERLGGRVGVQSEKEHGSRFYFTLPLSYSNQKDIENITKKEFRKFTESF